MSITWVASEELMPVVSKNLIKPEIALDIGCGIRPQQFVRPLVHICCEPFSQYVDHLMKATQNAVDRTYIIVNATWAEAVKLFPPKSVDTIFLVDVIEHLNKAETTELLIASESIARRQLVIFTPLGFMPQQHPDGRDAWGLDGGMWQEHKSGWTPDDFDDTWDVYASKVFHTSDNVGKPLDVPFGAFWAIKSLSKGSVSSYFLRRVKLRLMGLINGFLGVIHRA